LLVDPAPWKWSKRGGGGGKGGGGRRRGNTHLHVRIPRSFHKAAMPILDEHSLIHLEENRFVCQMVMCTRKIKKLPRGKVPVEMQPLSSHENRPHAADPPPSWRGGRYVADKPNEHGAACKSFLCSMFNSFAIRFYRETSPAQHCWWRRKGIPQGATALPTRQLDHRPVCLLQSSGPGYHPYLQKGHCWGTPANCCGL